MSFTSPLPAARHLAAPFAAMGLTAMTLAIFSLRSSYLKAGGKEERLKQFLTSAEMEKVNEAMQRDAKQIDNAQTDCGKVVGELLAVL